MFNNVIPKVAILNSELTVSLTIFIFLTSCKSSNALTYFLPLHSALIACIFLAAVK